MIGKTFSVCALWSMIVLMSAALYLVIDGGDNGDEQNPDPASPGSPTSALTTTQQNDKRADENACPLSKGCKVAGCAIGGIFGGIFLYFLYPIIKDDIQVIDLKEEDAWRGHRRVPRNRSAPDAPPPVHTERATGRIRRPGPPPIYNDPYPTQAGPLFGISARPITPVRSQES